MKSLKAIHHGSPHDWEETDLAFIRYGGPEIVLRIAGLENAGHWVEFAEYRFRGDSRLRVLEEMDLASYWASGIFRGRYLLWEIQAGGWLDGREDEDSQLLCVWKSSGAREWLLATTNFSVTVASLGNPTVISLHPQACDAFVFEI